MGFPGGSVVKNMSASAEDMGSVSGSGRLSDNPLQHSCLENAMDRGAWWATAIAYRELDTTEQLSMQAQVARVFMSSQL